MYIILDAFDPDLLDEVKSQIAKIDARPVDDATRDNTLRYFANGGWNIVGATTGAFEAEHDVSRRHHMLWMASKGVRMYSDQLSKEHPLYGGALPKNEDAVRRVIADARFAEGRAEYFSQFEVNYIGRTALNPRSIIILDNKKGNPTHNPFNDDSLRLLYSALPADWWGSCGFVSTGNVDKLGEFLEIVPDSIPLAYTASAASKLKYLGVDFAQIDPPSEDPHYGRNVREKANRLSYDLSFK